MADGYTVIYDCVALVHLSAQTAMHAAQGCLIVNRPTRSRIWNDFVSPWNNRFARIGGNSLELQSYVVGMEL
jgi:hypothetical protein